MITTKMLSNLLSAKDDAELEKVLAKMSEADVKAVLRIIISTWNKERIEGLKLQGIITE